MVVNCGFHRRGETEQFYFFHVAPQAKQKQNLTDIDLRDPKHMTEASTRSQPHTHSLSGFPESAPSQVSDTYAVDTEPGDQESAMLVGLPDYLGHSQCKYESER